MPSLTFSELESTRNIVKLAEATRTNIGLQVSGQWTTRVLCQEITQMSALQNQIKFCT